MAYPITLAPEAWAQIRYEYEHTRRKVVDICAAHGISEGTLQDRVRRWRWKPRGVPIPREGPPAVVIPRLEYRPMESFETPHPNPLPQGEREFSESAATASFPPLNQSEEPSPHVQDDRPIAQRLQSAVARVMPALETTLASLAGRPMAPREMEQAARALGALTRTLRELNALLAEHGGARGGAGASDDPPPEDMDEFRNELARRIHALVDREEEKEAARYEEAWQSEAAPATPPA